MRCAAVTHNLPAVYSTCLFCNGSLGSNESLEHFPIGRRIAFDAARGRLWVVCSHCARWNLTPLEERWEAIEEAERLFRGTRLRLSTDNIGLARSAEGTDLIRIGQPQRPEMAAWRYGRQFATRRRRLIVGGATTAVAFGTTAALVPLTGLTAGMLAGVGATAAAIAALGSISGSVVFRHRFVRDETGDYLRITPNELPSVRLVEAPGGWALRVPYTDRRSSLDARLWDWVNKGSIAEASLTGPAALEAARRLLPLVNGGGAPARKVDEAVRLIADWRGPEHAFATAASHVHEWAAKQNFGDTGALRFLPQPVRLALEMSAHEEQEQRALQGELVELARAWRDAEEIAAIADNLLLPDSIHARLAALRNRS